MVDGAASQSMIPGDASGSRESAWRSRAFTVVYRDEDIVVVDKAPGVLSVPTPRREPFTLVHEVSRMLSKGPRFTREALVVHRLDRDTSGLVVFACHPAARDRLMRNWAEHDRVYAAVVAGVVIADDDVIQSRLITDRQSLQRRSSHRDDVGEEAITRFVVAARLVDATLLSVNLSTGRRNQIRVHLAERGHPVLGDERYGGLGRHPRWDDRRLALHARLLAFAHPRTGAPLSFDTGLPPAFARFIERARSNHQPHRAQAGSRASTTEKTPPKGPRDDGYTAEKRRRRHR
jgi:23S rRNA pseudouridine1911/1915/1917 synthase